MAGLGKAVRELPADMRAVMARKLERELKARNVALPERSTTKKAMPSFHDWLCEVSPSFNWNWRHSLFLQQLFEDWIANKFRHVMLSIGPQHGKSQTITVRGPAYLIERDPRIKIMVAAYDDTLARMFSRQTRALLQGRVALSKEKGAQDEWETAAGGGLRAGGLRSGFTGRGAHCFPAGTMVTTNVGRVAIENLHQYPSSVRILSYDTRYERTEFKSLQAFGIRQAVGLYRITTAAGRAVEATGDHPFWTGRGYIQASALTAGDSLVCLEESGDGIETVSDTVAMVERVCSEQATVYDIQVADNHNFFANGILSHNCIFVDDPTKNRREAESKAFRDAAMSGYRDDLRTRLNSYNGIPGKIWLTSTRWHYEDLSGQIQRSEEAGDWHVVNLPTLAEENDPLGRAIGEALCPELHSREELLKLQKALPRTFISLYQGRPAPAEGSVIQLGWFKRYRTPPAQYTRIIQSWDTAMKGAEINDPWACITIGEAKDGGLYILDGVRDNFGYPEGKRQILTQYLRWRPNLILIEDKSSGEALIQEYKHIEVAEAPGKRLPIKAIDPDGDKIARASEQSDTIEGGVVWLPESAAWLPEFEDEIRSFPVGAYDHYVDALSQVLKHVTGKRAKMRLGGITLGVPPPRPKDGIEDLPAIVPPTQEELAKLQTGWTWKDVLKYRS